MVHTDVIIVGAGASGLFAAAIAAQRGLNVTVLEKNSRCGRKIALTGKGRCNLTNTKPWEEFATHIHPKNVFFKNAFFAMSNVKVMEFFEKIGLPLVEERGNRVFPQSMRAMDVTDALVSYIEQSGVKIITDCNIDEIKRGEDSMFTVLSGGKSVISAPYIIIATGGLSYPSTGSTGDGYRFAKAFGHKISDCFPSLTALVPINYSQQYHGISLKNVEVSLLVNNQCIATEFGDLDFTNGGIEGPIGFRISRKAVQNIWNGQKVAVILDLKPAVTVQQLCKRVEREMSVLAPAKRMELENPGNQRIKTASSLLLPKLMPVRLIALFAASNAAMYKNGDFVQQLATALKSWRFDIRSFVGYERCVITAGGVSLNEISQKTMESKLVKGLYFAGEVIDLDGDTGGYNLQIAFSTAALAAQSIGM